MRCLAIFPFLCCTAALVLSLLCIFAGSKPGFMEDYNLFTLNTSMIGQTLLDNATDNLQLPPALQALQPTLEQVEQKLKDGEFREEAESAIKSLAQALNVHDFYSAHVLDYCEGYYEPDALVNSSSPSSQQPWKNVTSCSPPTAFNNFNATDILQRELPVGVLLTDLKWPQEINDAIQTISVAARVMFVLYCVGAALTGVCALGAFFTVFASGLMGPCINLLLDLVAAAALLIASGIASALAVGVTNAANQYGSRIGVAATRGDKFLVITWIATALLLVSAIGWLVDCCTGRHRRKYTTVQPYKSEMEGQR